MAVGPGTMKSGADGHAKEPLTSHVYELSTFMEPPLGGWLSTFDCFNRASRVVLAFYVCLLTQPMGLLRYLIKFHQIFHWATGAELSLCYFSGMSISHACHSRLAKNERCHVASKADKLLLYRARWPLCTVALVLLHGVFGAAGTFHNPW
eukprot:TRINITY_DN88225_c0_g1_i1.p2 TRINITY_DN88225_c0_g1~~TRINITY_DN88225_c0_g1_i1.p2  ORF type:complete len:161 (-),score=18.17 TRINITY_DN88225_c0_g1_i1:294-743(-)